MAPAGIADEAERLSRLVGNLIDMTRLQSGVEIRRDWYPLEEIVGAALQRMAYDPNQFAGLLEASGFPLIVRPVESHAGSGQVVNSC